MRTGCPRVTHPCATFDSPKKIYPFDLHVLSTPPAFVLSQDQTLQLLSPDQSLGSSHQKFQGPDFNLSCRSPTSIRLRRLFRPASMLFSFQRSTPAHPAAVPAVFGGHPSYPAFQPPSRTFLFFLSGCRRLNFRSVAESAATGQEYTPSQPSSQQLFSGSLRFFCSCCLISLILSSCLFPFAFAPSFVVQ